MTRARVDDSFAKSVNHFLIGDLVYSTLREESKGGYPADCRENHSS